MNKAQLVEAVAEQLGGRRAAAEAVDAVLDTIVRAVTAGDRVSVTGFGTFEKVDRAARFARNPQTGDRVKVKKTAVPRFRPGQGFKDLVSGSKKLPKSGVSVRKAPKGSLTPGKSGMVAPAGSPAAKKAAAAAKKATAKKTTPTVKKAAAKKATTAAAATTAPAAKKATPAKKATTAKTAAAKKTTAAAKKTTAAVKAPAKKTVTASTSRPAAKKATTVKKATSAAKKTTAKKAPAKKAAAK
ncbi:HU family DNA-binding protein [Streptacidiphilus jiangxiensis]|uniref:HU family DNA-binding protein n=1 Tax=Streptacidiphilus jiangxiensis TaxID=235985 RepID=UPI0005A703A5|nr:HU family DNA-binding protein [Streptacidiphilus jiangxiensis]